MTTLLLKSRLLAALLLASLPTWLLAQAADLPDADREPGSRSTLSTPAATTGSQESSTTQAFTLDIQAPDEIAQLLDRHLELQRYRELADLSDEELERLLGQAQEDARKLIATLGYFSPEIRLERLADDAAPQRTVRVTVLPGEPTQISAVQIQFRGAIASDPEAMVQRQLIESSWSLPVGKRFTQAAWEAAKQQALRQLTVQRYPAGQIVDTLADIDPDQRQARLHLTVDSGPAYHTGELVISGLSRYDEAMVRRLARIAPGNEYRQLDLVEAQQRLSNSGYFDSAFVMIDTQSDPQAAQILVRLREARLQKLVLGLGASTNSGPRLSLEHTHHKVPGIGWRALSKLQLERNDSQASLELTSPPDGDNWRWVLAGLVQNQLLGTRDVTSQQLRGGRSQIAERIDRKLYLQYDRAETVSSDERLPAIAESVSANYAFTVRYYDQLPFPTAGWGWGAELGGGTTLGSQPQAFTRALMRWQGFLPLGATGGRAGRLAMRATAGVVSAEDSINLPSTQLFLAGGDNSVRGYPLHDIGVKLADGSTTAGRYLNIASIEWQRPIRVDGRLTAWESTVFIDAGAVANQPSEMQAKVGAGVGARWNSPLGPVQIDLAYGVQRQRFRLHLNLGFTF